MARERGGVRGAMRLRRRKPEREKRPGVPNGPPVRLFDCDPECETWWDREPRHTEACEKRWREAAARVDARQREIERQFKAYFDYKERAGAGRGAVTP